jgi:hypothetical protein
MMRGGPTGWGAKSGGCARSPKPPARFFLGKFLVPGLRENSAGAGQACRADDCSRPLDGGDRYLHRLVDRLRNLASSMLAAERARLGDGSFLSVLVELGECRGDRDFDLAGFDRTTWAWRMRELTPRPC